VSAPKRVCCVSLEPWDEVWRRNQHLAHQLATQGLVDHVLFVEPPRRSGGSVAHPEPNVTVVTPPLRARAGLGGLHLAARWLRRKWMSDVDLLWVNNAPLGVHLLRPAVPCVYDVTDDWRHTKNSARGTRRLVAAEDRLAQLATTIVCSDVLHDRWQERYGVDAAIVHNGVDVDAYRHVSAVDLEGASPHLGYVGSLHQERLDIELVLAVARATSGSIHLVGPDYLNAAARAALSGAPNIRFEGRIPAVAVPGWLLAMDVLLVPHLVTPFTLSLDAIKAYEYMATDRPIVATPSSGFQSLEAPGVSVVDRDGFDAAVKLALEQIPTTSGRRVVGWDERARDFARALPWPSG
jgi:teichuronic acid biosynthesis glycosyltransferase TuaH